MYLYLSPLLYDRYSYLYPCSYLCISGRGLSLTWLPLLPHRYASPSHHSQELTATLAPIMIQRWA